MQRRSFLIAGAAMTVGATNTALAQALRRTPGQIVGPYYPVIKPADSDADLTQVAGRPQRAAGQIIEISGRVFNEAGKPIENAEIEIWQADSHGHYTHPSDRTSGLADPNFGGYASIRSDRDGHYRFISIKPAAYPDDGAGGMRAPHIHFQITGKINRLATQMYFPGEPLNDTDRVLAFANSARERLILNVNSSTAASGLTLGTWDIVLRDG
jgi:protocatechuate 3,4-dioxygenase, beta subunit